MLPKKKCADDTCELEEEWIVENFQIEECEYVAVVGGGHGIGLALVEHALSPEVSCFCKLQEESAAAHEPPVAYPNQLTTFQLDPVNEHQLENWSEQLSSLTERIDLVINCVGMLHDDQWKPEKSLRSLSFEQLARCELGSHTCISEASFTCSSIRNCLCL